MKEPLLLLVDDDRAVLDALEAELTPVFEEICRIEAFDNPRAVLEALPGWAAEERRVAVAIVDQKMPGMTGVELLTEMRASVGTNQDSSAPENHAADGMRAILLTGYAGLDSAIAAKNEAGVDRYLEKPWRASELRSETQSALGSWLERSPHAVHYVMRLAESVDEVRETFRLRYAIYAETALLRALRKRDDDEGMETDPFDKRARLFCLMKYGPQPPAMVGALRVVGQETSPQLDWMLEVSEPHPNLRSALSAEPEALLPLLEYLPEKVAVTSLVEELLASGERLTEPSRLVLRREYRARATGTRQPLARHLIESAVAFFFFFFRIPHAMLTCVTEHRVFYRPYGFRLTEGTSPQLYPKFGLEIACLHGRMDSVPEAARARCEELASRIRRTGGACCCEAFPDCLGGPYGTGDFSATDVFCPLLARQRLVQLTG